MDNMSIDKKQTKNRIKDHYICNICKREFVALAHFFAHKRKEESKCEN